MELSENISKICKELKLSTISEKYHAIGTTAAKESWTYAQFLNEMLQLEISARLSRSKNILTKFAGFPAIKTLEEFDYDFYPQGAPRQLV